MYVGIAFEGTCKPAAQQVAVGQFHHSGAVAGTPAAVGDGCFNSTHFGIEIALAIGSQTGQSGEHGGILFQLNVFVFHFVFLHLFFSLL